MNRWLDCVQIPYDCSLGISDDLITFWAKSIKNKMAAAASRSRLKKDGRLKSLWV